MASTAQEEQAYLDGTHPALVGGNQALPPRPDSPTLNSDDSSPRFQLVDNDPSTQPPPPPTNSRSTGASNTGPKGVLADYKASQLKVAEQAGKSLLGMQKLHITAPPPLVFTLGADKSDEDDEFVGGRKGDGDERAIENYRKQRLAELSGSGQRQGSGKVFGHLREIGEAQFLAAIEDEAHDVAVVIHLYEPEFEACDQLNIHLAAIARAYPHTKFLRALATEVEFSTDTEEDTLPTLLVYRGGDLETTIIRVEREWGRGERSDVVALLARNGTISITPTVPFSNYEKSRYLRSTSHDSDE